MIKFEPSRCEDSLKDSMWDSDRYVAEPKIDGTRNIMYLDKVGVRGRMISRGQSIDRGANVPHITTNWPDELEGTVIDGEIVHFNDGLNDFASTLSLFMCNTAESVKRQEVGNKLTFVAFDILMYKGEDIRKKSLADRRVVLEQVVALINNSHMILVDQVKVNKREFFSAIVNAGGEGIVLKDTKLRYGNGWVKVKNRVDLSVVISGLNHANGTASVDMSVTENGRLVNVGSCAATSNELQNDIRNNSSKYLGQVLDIHAFGLSKDRRLRNPIWFRLRPDVDVETITMEKLVRDFN